MTDWRFLLYAPQDSTDLANELGRSDYSYWFVLNYFRPMLDRLGETVVLASPHETPDPGAGKVDLRLLFMPPHTIPLDLAATSIPVFAWEYTTIPTEPWAGEPRNDWREVLQRAPGAITHSRFAERAVRDALGDDYLVASLPAPVWDQYAPLAQESPPQTWHLDVSGGVIDSWEVGLRDGPDLPMPAIGPGPRRVAVSGVVFTAVINPDDGRKVWEDTITAFVWAHRDNPEAVLFLKLVHFDRATALGITWDFMRRLAPYRCRILAVHAFLPDEQFAHLIAGSSFVVNSSRGEGQCLPLMEFMSAGVPAVAPDHTALAEYIDPGDAFVVRSTAEWTHWPHDPRRFLRCLMHPVEWDSLRAGMGAAFQMATDRPREYRQMRRAASTTLQRHCSVAAVQEGMTAFLSRLQEQQSGHP